MPKREGCRRKARKKTFRFYYRNERFGLSEYRLIIVIAVVLMKADKLLDFFGGRECAPDRNIVVEGVNNCRHIFTHIRFDVPGPL